MARPKGTPKTGGRQKGTKNKNSLNIKHALDAADFNVIEEAIQALKELAPIARLPYLFQLIRFIYPTLKEADQLPDPDDSLKGKSTDDLLRLANG